MEFTIESELGIQYDENAKVLEDVGGEPIAWPINHADLAEIKGNIEDWLEEKITDSRDRAEAWEAFERIVILGWPKQETKEAVATLFGVSA